MRPASLFLKRKDLIDDQCDGAEAEPMQNPFLPAKVQTSVPEDQANQRACSKRETEDAAEPLLSRAAPAWHRVTKTLKNSKRTTLLRNQMAQPKGRQRPQDKDEPAHVLNALSQRNSAGSA
jgi:hypothetical protein